MWPCMRLRKSEKRGETKVIRLLEVALYEAQEIRELRGSVSQMIDTVGTYVYANSAISDSFFHSTHTDISSNKRKRKEAYPFFLYISFVLFLFTQHLANCVTSVISVFSLISIKNATSCLILCFSRLSNMHKDLKSYLPPCDSLQSNVCKSLSLLRAYNFCSLQYACFH